MGQILLFESEIQLFPLARVKYNAYFYDLAM